MNYHIVEIVIFTTSIILLIVACLFYVAVPAKAAKTKISPVGLFFLCMVFASLLGVLCLGGF